MARQPLTDVLQLPSEGMEALRIAGFGGSTCEDLQHMERSTVYIVTGRRNIPVSVLIVLTIAAPFSRASLRSAAALPYLRGLKVVHPISGNTFHISLLVEADHY